MLGLARSIRPASGAGIARRSVCSAPTCAYEAQHISDALRDWREAGELGNAEAQYRIGLLYERGEGVHRSWPDAVVWYKRAAEQGHTEAQYQLRYLYLRGSPEQKMADGQGALAASGLGPQQ